MGGRRGFRGMIGEEGRSKIEEMKEIDEKRGKKVLVFFHAFY